MPQRALIHNIPGAMWDEEAIGRIASSLGSPIEARSSEPVHPDLPPPLEACVIIGRTFSYPPALESRSRAMKVNQTETIVSVEYAQRVPYCCEGFGH